MKNTALSVAIAVILSLSMVGGTAVASLPSSHWVTNIQVQNVGSDTAAISVTSIAGGTSYTSSPKTAAVGGSANFANTELGLPSSGSFQGAGAVSSDQPIFAILYVTNTPGGPGYTASAITRGVGSDSTASSLGFPLAKKNWGIQKKTTTFYIQNAGSATTSITAHIAVIGPSEGTCSNNDRVFSGIRASEQINFTPEDLGCPSSMYGSLTVTSSGGTALDGIVLEADDSTASPAGGTHVVAGTTGFAISGSNPDYDTVLLAPIIKKSYGQYLNVTGLQVQNVSTDATTIPVGGLVVSYTVVSAASGSGLEEGDVVTEANTTSIAKGASFNSLHTVLPAGTLASATVKVYTADARIVGIVNENRPSGTTVFRNTTYGMLPKSAAATSVSLPMVKEFYGRNGGRCSGVQVVAVGNTVNAAAIMELTYTNSSGTSYVVTTNEAVHSKTFQRISVAGFTPDVTYSGGDAEDMSGQNFAVTATSKTSGVKLVAVANESFCPNSTRDEDDANYEGFPLE